MDENEIKKDMVDATDCLEAVTVFKSMKNLLFFIVFICLLLLQGVFWLNETGYVDKAGTKYESKTIGSAPVCGASLARMEKQQDAGPEAVSGTSEEAETADEKIEELAQLATEEMTENTEAPAEVLPAAEASPKFFTEVLVPKASQVAALIKTCNFILIIAACMYMLTLFMSIKISLAGRLGGLNHISRAFFRSLFAFVLLLPWQLCSSGVVTGAVYTPEELFNPCGLVADATLAGQIFYYLRFVGLWLIVFVLIVSAQFRTRKWSKATLRRLGIAH